MSLPRVQSFEAVECRSDSGDVLGSKRKSVLPFIKKLGDTAARFREQNGRAGMHRLIDDEPPVFRNGGKDECRAASVEVDELSVVLVPEELDAGDVFAAANELIFLHCVACEVEAEVASLLPVLTIGVK